MAQSYLSEPHEIQRLLTDERPRLVRLASYLTGDAAAAEDIVQEALLVAWRRLEEVRDPLTFSAWLSGITRNMSLRWLRKHARDVAATHLPRDEQDPVAVLASPDDLEFELERADLSYLLDQALALLPDETRELLVQKYIEESTYREMAQRFGLSENAVAVRVHRGKLTLRNVLSTELLAEARACGLLAPEDLWRATRIWCTSCGQERLVGKLSKAEFALRCPRCDIEPGSFHSQDCGGKVTGSYKSYRPALKRFSVWMHDFFTAAILEGFATCRICGARLPFHLTMPHYAPPATRAMRGMHIFCETCNRGSYNTLHGLALGSPAGQAFFQAHPRIRDLPIREIEHDGVAALVVGYESVGESATFEVVLSRDRYVTLYGGENDG